MIIRTVSFDPIKVEIDGVETPLMENSYIDVDGIQRKVSYIIKDGEKILIQHQAELMNYLVNTKLDDALVKVESDRKKKLEDPKEEDKKP